MSRATTSIDIWASKSLLRREQDHPLTAFESLYCRSLHGAVPWEHGARNASTPPRTLGERCGGSNRFVEKRASILGGGYRPHRPGVPVSNRDFLTILIPPFAASDGKGGWMAARVDPTWLLDPTQRYADGGRESPRPPRAEKTSGPDEYELQPYRGAVHQMDVWPMVGPRSWESGSVKGRSETTRQRVPTGPRRPTCCRSTRPRRRPQSG